MTEKLDVPTLKSGLMCGDCKSAKFMIWDKKRMDERPNGAFYEVDQEVYVLVRCDFFRLTVAGPGALLKCEGYRQK